MRKKAKKVADSIVVSLGYSGLLLQVIWLSMLYISWAVQSGAIDAYLNATKTSSTQPTFDIVLPEIIRGPLMIVVVALVLIVTIYFVRTTPRHATNITIRATEKTSKAARPIIKTIVHNKEVQKKITPSISLFLTQLVLSVVIMLVTLPAQWLVVLETEIFIIVTLSLWIATTGMISLHYMFQKIWHISRVSKH